MGYTSQSFLCSTEFLTFRPLNLTECGMINIHVTVLIVLKVAFVRTKDFFIVQPTPGPLKGIQMNAYDKKLKRKTIFMVVTFYVQSLYDKIFLWYLCWSISFYKLKFKHVYTNKIIWHSAGFYWWNIKTKINSQRYNLSI